MDGKGYVLGAMALAACSPPIANGNQPATVANRPVAAANLIFTADDASECPGEYAQISNQPEADALASIRRGERRLLANADGVGFIAPGVPPDETERLLATRPPSFRLLTGFQDAITADSCIAFRGDGLVYMERFNRAMLRLRNSGTEGTRTAPAR